MRIVVSFASLEEATDLGDAFWLADTPANRMIAEQAWSSAATDPNSALFNRDSGSDATGAALDIFDDIELHHPNWHEVRFFGSILTGEILAQFRDMQLHAEQMENGFVVRR